MRILYLTHRLPYAPNRGDRIRAYYVLRHLAARHAVDLVSFVHDDEEQSHAPDLSEWVSSTTAVRLRRAETFPRAAAALFKRSTLTHAILDSRLFRELLRRVIAHRRPDVVLAHCSGMARFAMEAPLNDVPFVLDMVDVDSEKWADLGRSASWPKRLMYEREAHLLRQFERRAIRTARSTLVVNNRERQTATGVAGGGRIDVVPNGIEIAHFHPPHAVNPEPRVVFCGVMNYAPNETGAMWLMREVWPRVHRARPDARLSIVGAYPARRLYDFAATDPSIEVTGAVPDVRPFLWRSAVAAAPLFVARGVQNKALEAVAAGLPVVATGAVIEGLPTEVLPACRLANTADEFADTLLALLDMSALERRAITRTISLEPLDWSRRFASLESILRMAVRPVRLTA